MKDELIETWKEAVVF